VPSVFQTTTHNLFESKTICMTKILIIDDDSDDSDLLRDAIQQIAPETSCTMASSSDEALQGMKTKKIPRPDLIFLDLNMPRVNGIQCLRELKAESDIREIPVAIYTTSKSHDDQVESLKLGASYFVVKPSSFRQLCKVISNIFTLELIQSG
jgi:DNA-binding response OmpR family regulator